MVGVRNKKLPPVLKQSAISMESWDWQIILIPNLGIENRIPGFDLGREMIRDLEIVNSICSVMGNVQVQ